MIEFNSSMIIGAGFTGIGVYTVVRTLRELGRAVDSEQWPVVYGEVLDAGVDSDYSSNTRMYKAVVRYRYTFAGVSHEGERVAFGGPLETSWRGPAQSVTESYPKGRRVKVRVSPADPSQSVLEPGAKWYVYAALLGGAVFIGIGVRMIMKALP